MSLTILKAYLFPVESKAKADNAILLAVYTAGVFRSGMVGTSKDQVLLKEFVSLLYLNQNYYFPNLLLISQNNSNALLNSFLLMIDLL